MARCTCGGLSETCAVHGHPEYNQALRSDTVGYYLKYLEKSLAFVKPGRPWEQRAAIIDAEVALGKIRGDLEKHGVI